MVAGVSWDVHSPSAATNMSYLLGPLPSSPETGSVDCDPDPATTSYHDSEGLDLSAALVVRAAEFAATTEQSVCQNLAAWLGPPGSTGKRTIEVRTTTKSGDKHAALVRWPAGERFVPHRHWGGEEILVLSGELIDEHGRYGAGTWLRSPHLSEHCPRTEVATLIWVKVGHLLR